jgi:DNA-directed RNA polymerase subunit RPC12/RpoP
MSFQCAKCSEEVEKEQGYDYQGNLFCEDCYMDILSPPKACDPWAVHSAQTFLKGKDKLSTLTPLQLKIVNHIEKKGEASAEEIMENIKLSEAEFRREFAVLRHMEILRATKNGDKIFYTLFYKQS